MAAIVGSVRIAFIALVSLIASAAGAFAQTDTIASFPNKPIRLIVGFAAGGGNDIFARMIQAKVQERTGWTVIVENKPGAGGRVAAEYVAREPADGYTLLVGASGAMAIGPLIFKTNYDTLTSFTPVTLIGDFPLFLVVGADHPAKSIKDLVEWTNANAEKANYATSSPAFTLPTELFKMKSGAKGLAIPYKSSNESVLGVIAGNAAMTIVDPPPAVSQVKGGKLRALAVLAKDRFQDLPDVPTMAEAGVEGVNVSLWSGFFLPAGAPKPIVEKLHKELSEVITKTDVKDKLSGMAVNPKGSGTDDFARLIADEQKMWSDVIKAGNLKFGG